MSIGAVAQRYAEALFELGSEQGKLSGLSKELSDFAASYEKSAEFKSALLSPLLSDEARDKLVEAVAKKVGVSDLGIRSLKLMASRGRLVAISEVASRLGQMCDEKEGVLRAKVTTANEMPESYFQKLTQQLTASTNKKIILERAVDKSLVAGAIAQVADSVLDASVRGRLEKFERDVLSAISAGSPD